MRRSSLVLACTAAFVLSFQGAPARAAAPGSPADPRPDPAQVDYFEKKVRPLLDRSCFQYHGADKKKGGLRLDSRAGMLEGGDSGPAIVPGQPDRSRLVQAVRYADMLRMPPKEKLKDDEVAVLTAWVKMGAPWPEPAAAARPAAPASTFKITEKDRAFWAFQPVKTPALPEVRDSSWVRSPTDRFLLTALEKKGLRPAPAADRRTLLRRVTFDL